MKKMKATINAKALLFVLMFVFSLAFTGSVYASSVSYLRGKDVSLFPIAKKSGLVFKALLLNNIVVPKYDSNGKLLALNGKYKGCYVYGPAMRFTGGAIFLSVSYIRCGHEVIVHAMKKHFSRDIGEAISLYNGKIINGIEYKFKNKKRFVKKGTKVTIFITAKTTSLDK